MAELSKEVLEGLRIWMKQERMGARTIQKKKEIGRGLGSERTTLIILVTYGGKGVKNKRTTAFDYGISGRESSRKGGGGGKGVGRRKRNAEEYSGGGGRDKGGRGREQSRRDYMEGARGIKEKKDLSLVQSEKLIGGGEEYSSRAYNSKESGGKLNKKNGGRFLFRKTIMKTASLGWEKELMDGKEEKTKRQAARSADGRGEV